MITLRAIFMTMQSGNVVLSDTMQLPTVAGSGGGGVSGGGSGSGEIHRLQPCQWFFDERDSFISWLRGEFAAANAIIDSLCYHLRIVGEPGEYDAVIACIQQRRSNWNPVLHLQPYFSVAEVTHALHQASFKRQQTQRHFDQLKGGGKELRRTGMGFKQGQRFEVVKETQNSGVEGGENSSGILVSELKSAKDEEGQCLVFFSLSMFTYIMDNVRFVSEEACYVGLWLVVEIIEIYNSVIF